MLKLKASLAAALAVVAAGLTPAMAHEARPVFHEARPVFEAGAANVDITPPARSAATDALYVPVCGPSASVIQQVWTGARAFAFEEPYVDAYGLGHYAPGDPYCDVDGRGYYQAPWIAGGSGVNHWPTSTDPSSPIGASAVVFRLGSQRLALVVVDSIGLFNVTMDQIRADVRRVAPDVSQVFVSSTHDESAPDPVGLWGPDTSSLPGNQSLPAPVSPGVDEAYFAWMSTRVAGAVAAADAGAQPAALRLAVGRQPANTQSCWSSYPFIDAQLLPVMQAVSTKTGQILFTMVNANTHVESLAFSSSPAYQARFSGDWVARTRADLAARWPGSVGVELTGLVGSVETPTIYGATTQVVNVPGPLKDVPGNPDGCRSVYPTPAGGVPVSDAEAFIDAYGQAVASAAESALASATTVRPASLGGTDQSLCVQLENNLFAAAFAGGIFPDRPAYADPGCTVGVAPRARSVAGPTGGTSSAVHAPLPMFVKTDVGVMTIGPVTVAYSPGEVFPFTEMRGFIDDAHMPFPGLGMTPWVSARMPGSLRMMAGLGQDMIGYLMPPGDFVGDQGETFEQPWLSAGGGRDRFGQGHSDDSESLGPHAGEAVTAALTRLLDRLPGPRPTVMPGLYADPSGRLSDSPFASPGFAGAVGVVVKTPGGGTAMLRGPWITYLGTIDTGTAGTTLPYSVATAGVETPSGPVLIDVFAGASSLTAS